MHMRGRHILKFYPILVEVFDSEKLDAIWSKYKFRRIEDHPNIGSADTISVNGVAIPLTLSEAHHGLYFYFPKDHPSALEFKLRYGSTYGAVC